LRRATSSPRTEEQTLIAAIDAPDLSPFRFQGWAGKRLTASYGWTYDFETGRMSQGDPLAGLAAAVSRPRRKVCRAAGGRPGPGTFDPLRPNGAASAGTRIARLSSMSSASRSAPRPSCGSGGAAAGGSSASLPLEPRGAYYLGGEARHEWEHSIAEMDRARWSVTFRSLVDRAIQLASSA
jgi:alkylated DNA repair protein (DNA oxidative demethylase)